MEFCSLILSFLLYQFAFTFSCFGSKEKDVKKKGKDFTLGKHVLPLLLCNPVFLMPFGINLSLKTLRNQNMIVIFDSKKF
jgi:hypothetical protein